MRKLLLYSTLASLLYAPLLPAQQPAPAPHYEFKEEHDPNGIGKFYMGREIARVMGHQAASWLERPEREEEERTDLLLQSLELKPNEVVADIGAGSGYFSWRIAKALSDGGKVYAVDIQQEMLDLLQLNMSKRRVTNVVSILGTVSDPKLPAAAVDTILMVDVYHEFDHPREMVESMIRSLRPGGRIVLVEFRAEDPKVNIKRVHKMSEAQAIKEIQSFPELRWEKTIPVLPQQHILIFRKS